MSKKIMIVCGSPRGKGNTISLAIWAAEAARAEGATVEIVDAASLDYKTNGCLACMGCQASERYACVVADEATDIIERIPDFDVLVLASPVFFMGLSAQIKLLLDRMFSLFKFDGDTFHTAPGFDKIEMAHIVVAGGDASGGLQLVDQNVQAIAGFLGKKSTGLLVHTAPQDPDEIADDADLRARAEAFGRQLAR